MTLSSTELAETRRRHGGSDRGSGSILALMIVVAVVTVSLTVVALGSGLASRQRVIAAADAGALAAADAASGAVAGVPCELAAEVAGAHRARLAACEIEGVRAVVTVEGAVLGVVVTARARAGPAPGPDSG